MRKELDDKLTKDFPLLYKSRQGSYRYTSMCWGFQCGDGWFDLLYNLSEKLEIEIRKIKERNDKPVFLNTYKKKWNRLISQLQVLIGQYLLFLKGHRWTIYRKLNAFMFFVNFDESFLPKANTVKEKFGTLRFYMDGETDLMSKYIEEAEDLSAKTCETCGAPGKVTSNGGWISCLCSACRSLKN